MDLNIKNVFNIHTYNHVFCFFFYRSFLGVTAHWINENNLKRKQRVLKCMRLIGSHTYDVLAKALDAVHCDFGIEEKVIKTTTDNGSNFVKAFK